MVSPTVHPLNGVRAKLARAEESIESLNREIVGFLASQPPYRATGRLNEDRSEYGFHVSVDFEPPLRFAILAGEIIHHLRSILDHLVYALVVEAGGTPTIQHQFPICSTVEEFTRACERKRLEGVSENAIRIIRSVQPFNWTPPTENSLALIGKQDNIDKHRLLILTAAAGQIGERVSFRSLTAGSRIVGMSPPFPREIGSKGGKVFWISFGEPFPTAAEIEADFEIVIAVETDTTVGLAPIDYVLRLSLDNVRKVVTSLEPEFSTPTP